MIQVIKKEAVVEAEKKEKTAQAKEQRKQAKENRFQPYNQASSPWHTQQMFWQQQLQPMPVDPATVSSMYGGMTTSMGQPMGTAMPMVQSGLVAGQQPIGTAIPMVQSGLVAGQQPMMMMMQRLGRNKFRFPCKACGMPGHWVRDGLCRPEDVAAKLARDYVAQQLAAGQQMQQPDVPAISPPGE
jgi:hypothetical protein